MRPERPARSAPVSRAAFHDDVLFSLLTVCQLVIDIAGKLAARRRERLEDYTGAIRALGGNHRFPAGLVRALEPLPGFRNVLVHEHVVLDLERAVAALRALSGRSPGS
jgi:uncharacterized protein YutE (UPF0331/DUF86 family)